MKQLVKQLVGQNNITWLRSLFPSKAKKDYIQRHSTFYTQLLKTGDTYFDVGANIGDKLEPLINYGIKIIAIEPQTECISYLKKKFGNKITIVPKGLGAKEEIKKLKMTSASTISSFSDEWINATKESGRFSEFDWNETRDIELTTLDKLIKQFGKPTYIKIDVEGFELEVLKGLNTPIKFISFEYTVPEQLGLVKDCLKRIADISDNNIVCNYYHGDSLVWALDNWIGLREMLEHITTPEFIQSSMGDIYVKYINN